MSAALRNVSEPTEIFARLRDFLCTRYWLPKADFPHCTDVFEALGLAGDDCHDFMESYSLAFGVDLTDYIWPKFHLAEEEEQDVRSVLRPLMRFAGLKTQPMNRDLVPLSIDHLFQVAQTGSWFDPAPETIAREKAGAIRNFTRFSARLRAGGLPRKPHR